MLQRLADDSRVLHGDGWTREIPVSNFGLRKEERVSTFSLLSITVTTVLKLLTGHQTAAINYKLATKLLLQKNNCLNKRQLTSSSANTERLKKAPRQDSLWISLPQPGLRGLGHHNSRDVTYTKETCQTFSSTITPFCAINPFDKSQQLGLHFCPRQHVCEQP